jgi:hypothetical protein
MARERAVHERGDADEADGERADAGGARLLDRRSYLGLAGAAVASVAGLSAAGEASAATRVDVVEAGADPNGDTPVNDVIEREHGDGVELYFPPGEYLLDPISLSGSNWALVGDDATLLVPGDVDRTYLSLSGDGWRMEGFTVDLTADGAAPVNYPRGTNWTMRDVEFVGRMDDPDYRSDSDLFFPAVESSGATGLMENVVATDGSADPDGSSNRGLMWLGQNNQGTLTFRGCHFSNWANNTLYAANSAGRIVIEDCLFENTNVGVRIGGNTVVRDCTWKQDGPVPAQRWSGDANGRGLWINSNQYVPGEILVEGCEFIMTGPDATSALLASNRVDRVSVRDTRIEQHNGQAAVELPGTGPLEVEQVVVTGDSTGAAIDITDRDDSTLTGLCVQKPGTGVRIRDSSGCRIADSTVAVDGTTFDFSGSVVETDRIARDGTCPVPDGSSSGGSGDGSTPEDGTTGDGSSDGSLANTLTVRGTGTPTNYEFTVDGDLESNPDVGPLQEWDNISETTATGWVTDTDDGDGYRFSGSITDFTVIEGDARIFLNGEEVTSDEAVSDSTLPRTVTIRGTGTSTNYEFTVDEEVKADPEAGDLQQWDSIDGRTVNGWVTETSHVDSYRFSGSITDFAFVEGEAEVTVDGETVDPATLGSSGDGSTDEPIVPDLPHRVVIGQPDGDVTSDYSISVTDTIAKSEEDEATIEASDTVSDGTAEGSVSGDTDAFRFSGGLTRFVVDGTATVDLQRNV